ncbi:MAG: hypothetical protein SVX38_03135 [Chloroflexota bacterium]|nr:hypothetical protein [Chloroflexota bacterium]
METGRIVIAGAVALLLVLSSLACSISGQINVEGPALTIEAGEEQAGDEETPPPTAAPPVVTETETTGTEEESTESAAPEMPPGKKPLEVAEISELEVTTLDPRGEGMGHLGTFRQRMNVSFTGQESGYNGAYRYDAEVNTTEQAVHITVSAEGPAAKQLPSNQAQAIWIGPQLWLKVGNQPWVPVPESVAEIRFEEQMYTVSDFLPYVQHFQRVEPDKEVNGILSAHYTYDAQNLPTQYGSVSGHGEIYVALEGGYVVRYTLEGSGEFHDYFQGSGTLRLVYDTYDVGADISISPPRR